MGTIKIKLVTSCDQERFTDLVNEILEGEYRCVVRDIKFSTAIGEDNICQFSAMISLDAN